ncbi:fibrinogen-like protein 1 [Saccostrea cucullata]|uniref:fibrinogen-like protein 1 n=1 Tax=Saccostrea cuccullata TaxID=36930 RepID=UPI002ED47E88
MKCANAVGEYQLGDWLSLSVFYTVLAYFHPLVAAIQKRVDRSVIFDRNWSDYKNGFGSPEQKVWIGDSMRSVHGLMSFSAPDRDNDRLGGNCAAQSNITGEWWFHHCHVAFLNGH